ncbi:hypothetical protein BGZ60DRAFT_147508 [Tricladium varicosporioides]|nr:hypothetical protein BGZ60DRAFT_147508 [Hymenoscyphus varicosporioides]
MWRSAIRGSFKKIREHGESLTIYLHISHHKAQEPEEDILYLSESSTSLYPSGLSASQSRTQLSPYSGSDHSGMLSPPTNSLHKTSSTDPSPLLQFNQHPSKSLQNMHELTNGIMGHPFCGSHVSSRRKSSHNSRFNFDERSDNNQAEKPPPAKRVKLRTVSVHMNGNSGFTKSHSDEGVPIVERNLSLQQYNKNSSSVSANNDFQTLYQGEIYPSSRYSPSLLHHDGTVTKPGTSGSELFSVSLDKQVSSAWDLDPPDQHDINETGFETTGADEFIPSYSNNEVPLDWHHPLSLQHHTGAANTEIADYADPTNDNFLYGKMLQSSSGLYDTQALASEWSHPHYS